MALSADNLLDRIRMKGEISKWRTLAIVFAVLWSIGLLWRVVDFSSVKKDYIARIHVNGIIVEDHVRNKKLKALVEDKHVKAIIMHVNSPGGTIVGGEHLYNSIVEISEKKPVVAVMGTVAASAGYMTAIAAEKVFTSEGTMTGSIGVMIQSAEITDMAKKLGVNFISVKSGELKGSPSPTEKLTPRVEQVIKEGINDGYDYFVGLIEEQRPLTREEILKLADGRIYTGRQAVKNKLVDAIGDEDDALQWLRTEKNISEEIKVKTVKVKDKKSALQVLLTGFLPDNGGLVSQFSSYNGLMAMWKP